MEKTEPIHIEHIDNDEMCSIHLNNDIADLLNNVNINNVKNNNIIDLFESN